MAHDDNHRPGEPPPVRDEAADTPMWLPALGLALLVLAAVGIIYQSVQAEQDALAEAAEAGEEADAEPAETEEAPAGEGDEAE